MVDFYDYFYVLVFCAKIFVNKFISHKINLNAVGPTWQLETSLASIQRRSGVRRLQTRRNTPSMRRQLGQKCSTSWHSYTQNGRKQQPKKHLRGHEVAGLELALFKGALHDDTNMKREEDFKLTDPFPDTRLEGFSGGMCSGVARARTNISSTHLPPQRPSNREFKR